MNAHVLLNLLNELGKRYKMRGLVFVAIVTENSGQNWTNFILHNLVQNILCVVVILINCRTIAWCLLMISLSII